MLNGNIESEKGVHRRQRVSRSDGASQRDYTVTLLVTWTLGMRVLKPLDLLTITGAACRLNSAQWVCVLVSHPVAMIKDPGKSNVGTNDLFSSQLQVTVHCCGEAEAETCSCWSSTVKGGGNECVLAWTQLGFPTLTQPRTSYQQSGHPLSG